MRARGPVDPFGDRFATKPKASSQGHRAIVREAQKVESLRLAHPALATVHHREPAKFHEVGLVLVEAETEPGQPLPNVAEVPLRIPLVLEPDNDIVGVTDDDRFAIRVNGGAKLVPPGGAKLVHLTLCGTRCWGVVPVVHRRDPRCFV